MPTKGLIIIIWSGNRGQERVLDREGPGSFIIELMYEYLEYALGVGPDMLLLIGACLKREKIEC